MIKVINSLLGKFLGNKADRDLKEIQPLLQKINQIYPQLANDTNDELRARTAKFRQAINDRVDAERKRIAELTQLMDSSPDMDFVEKENHFEEIDKLKKKLTILKEF
jgi:preprotein translocase subunit SecA